MESSSGARTIAHWLLTLGAIGFCCAPASAQQQFATPGPNVNVVGLTPKLEHVPDFQLKQQQEPSCIQRPGNESYWFCAFNDLRASDLPIQKDGWIGVSISNDATKTWYSRLAPGYLGDPYGNSIDQGFAADPTVVAIPGKSPGLVVLNYIAGFRESSQGVLAIQRFVEYPKEDLEGWKPENGVRIVTTSAIEGGFIDKPHLKYIPESPATQGELTQVIDVEGNDPDDPNITVKTPTGTLIVVYGVFPDNSEGSILRLRRSVDNGETWSDAVELVNSPTPVNGASIAIAGDKIIIVYRQAGGEIVVPVVNHDDSDGCNNDDDSDGPCFEVQVVPDAVVAVACDNAANVICTEGTEVFQNCPIDQPASGSTFRTTAFPWLSWDGRRVWAFQADKNPGGACVEAPGLPGFFVGKSKIVAMSSINGTDWVGSAANPTEPIVIAPRAEGFQVMPVSLGITGDTYVAWTDTYREDEQGLPAGSGDVLINDYVSGFERVFRKADVWFTRLEHTCSSSSATAGCTPTIENPVLVSQYPTVADPSQFDVEWEIAADFKNFRTHDSGRKAFAGDYSAMAAAGVRQIADGSWISNEVPPDWYGPELAGFTDVNKVFVAWGDNRDVLGEFQSDPEGAGSLPYTPPINSDANPGGAVVKLEDIAPDDIVKPRSKMLADDTPDHAPGTPLGADLSTCVPGNVHTKARDANVYGSLIDLASSLVAPTPVKPLGGIQRMYPIEFQNTDRDNETTVCLAIANQPPDFGIGMDGTGTGLASFYQLPAIAPFSNGDQVDLLTTQVPAGSGASRAVFVSTSNASTIITVNAYEGACPTTEGETFGALINSVRVGNGLLFDPEYCNDNACDSVASNETHDISLVSPGVQAPGVQAPGVQAPGVQAPGVQAPGVQAPGVQAQGFLAPGVQAPGVQAPGVQAPGVQAPAVLASSLQAPGVQAGVLLAPGVQAPGVQAPGVQATALADAMLNDNPNDVIAQDVTYQLSADGNVTTTFSADIKITGLPGLGAANPADVEAVVQLIAWTQNVYTTVSNTDPCLAAPAAQQQVLAYETLDAEAANTLTLPFTRGIADQNPYIGDVTYTASPDKDVSVTVRFWATGEAKATLEQLQADLEACRLGQLPNDPFCDPNSGEYGAARLISFGASAHQCSTTDAVVNTETDRAGGFPEDCLDSDEEKIIPDLVPPIITAPDSLTFEATGPDGAIVEYTATVEDNLDSNPELICDPASGTLFGLTNNGPSTISCFASDFKGNSSIKTIEVFVVDSTAPDLGTFPPPFNPDTPPYLVDANSSTFTVSWGPIDATDTVSDLDVSCAVTSGPPVTGPIEGPFDPLYSFRYDFPVGTTTVTCTATDDTGNSVSGSFDITVEDRIGPVIVLAGDNPQTVEAGTAYVEAGVQSASDNVDGLNLEGQVETNGIVDANTPGTYVVTYSLTDSSGNTTTNPRTVNVVDTIAPTISPPADIIAEATGPTTVVSIGTATASDTVSDVTVTNNAPLEFPLGTTTVIWTAVDASGNTATAVQLVTVVDTTPPLIEVPNNILATTLSQDSAPVEFSVTATDVFPVTTRCVNQFGDPVQSGDEFPVGFTTVTCTATDSNSQAASASFQIEVRFVIGINLIVPKRGLKAGSTNPIDWQYLDPDTGEVIDSGHIRPIVSWRGPNTTDACNDNAGTKDGDDAGSSDIRYSASSKTWQFSWKTPDGPNAKGKFFKVFITPPGEIDPNASACVRLK